MPSSSTARLFLDRFEGLQLAWPRVAVKAQPAVAVEAESAQAPVAGVVQPHPPFSFNGQTAFVGEVGVTSVVGRSGNARVPRSSGHHALSFGNGVIGGIGAMGFIGFISFVARSRRGSAWRSPFGAGLIPEDGPVRRAPGRERRAGQEAHCCVEGAAPSGTQATSA